LGGVAGKENSGFHNEKGSAEESDREGYTVEGKQKGIGIS
jgi:hypothetical protein